jgi:hypothetical protein
MIPFNYCLEDDTCLFDLIANWISRDSLCVSLMYQMQARDILTPIYFLTTIHFFSIFFF